MRRALWVCIIALLSSSLAFAAIAQRGAATTTTNSTTTTIVISKPTGVVAGDVMIADIVQAGNSTTNASLTGWTLIAGAAINSGTTRQTVLYRVADGTEGTSFTFTLGTGSNRNAGAIVAFSGVDPSVFDVTPGTITASSGSSTSVTATAVTTVTASDAILMVGGSVTSTGSQPSWSGWSTTNPGTLTELYDANTGANTGSSVGAAWALKSATGSTGTGTATLSTSKANSAILLALKPLVTSAPTITKGFSPSTIAAGGTSTLTLTITNPNASTTLTGVAVTDNLPTGMTQTGAATTCTSGSVSGSTSTSIVLSGASINGGANCTVTATVTSSTAGNSVNTTGTVTSTSPSTTGGTANATLTVMGPPTIAKAFSPNSMPVGSTSTLTITLSNPSANGATALTGVGVTDTFPAGMGVAAAPNFTNTCGGTFAPNPGDTSLTLSGGTVPGSSGSCAISVSVTDPTAGVASNTTGNVTSTNGGNGGTATATLAVENPPTITKSFSPTTVTVNGTSTLTLTITNPAGNTVALTGLSVSDSFPTGLQVTSSPTTTNTCGGTFSASGNANNISLSGGSVSASSSCSVSVTVTPTAEGTYPNTTGNVSSTNGGTGTTASATLTATLAPTITKTFLPASIGVNGASTLMLGITNPSVLNGQNGLAVSDTFPTGMVTATILPWQATFNYSAGQFVLDTYGDVQMVTAAGQSGASPPWTQASTTVGAATTDGGVTWTDQGAMFPWQASTNYALGAFVFDTLGNVQQVTTAGQSGSSAPAWNTTPGLTTTDNTVTWTDLGSLTWQGGIIYPVGAIILDSNGNLELVTTSGTSGASQPTWNMTVGGTTPEGPDTLVWTNQGANAVNTCGGSFPTTAGAGTISLSGGSLPIGGSCTAAAIVTTTTSGDNINTTGAVSSTNQGTGSTATATLVAMGPPTITKGFTPNNIPVGGTSTLTLTITNPLGNPAQNGVAVSDTFPLGMSVAGTPNVTNTCGGTFAPISGDTTINLTGGFIDVNTFCTISVNVTSSTAGVNVNTTGNVSSTNGGTGGTATASLAVEIPPTITKAFSPTSIPVNGTSVLTLTITNPLGNTVALTGVGVGDLFPGGITVAATPGAVNTCGGTLSGASASSIAISLSGGSVSAGTFCTVSVNVTASAQGSYVNTTGNVSSSNGGTGTSATATLIVDSPPTITKSFLPTSINVGGTSTLTLTITNPSGNIAALTGVAVNDSFPSGLQVTSSPTTSNTCGGTFTANANATSISLSGGTVPVNSFCTVSVTVTPTTAGNQVNTTGTVSATNGGTGTTASAALTAISAPTITKSFGAASMPLNGTTTLTITITNPAANTVAQSGVAVSDPLPSGMSVASPTGATNTCGGTFAPNAGDMTLSLTGGTIATSSSCSISVNITSTTSGVNSNTTGNVSSTNGGTGGTATASVAVEIPPTITKSFAASPIAVGTGFNTTLSITITNPTGNTVTLTGLAVTDNFPTGLQVATTPSSTNTCNGTLSGATAASTSISLSGGTVAASSSCTISVHVSATAAGSLVNTTGTVSSTNGGTGLTASATLTAVSPPTIAKAFGTSPILVGGTSTLTLTMTNPAANTVPLTGVAVSDTFPSGVVVASTPNANNTCGGTFTATGGSGTISLTGGSIAIGGSCEVNVDVTASTAGSKVNTTGTVSSTSPTNTGTTASATLIVMSAPTITKAFAPTSMPVSGTSTLTITITNPSANTSAQTGVAVSDTFPAGMSVAATPGATNTCGGTFSPNPGDMTLSLSGGTVGINTSCAISVSVTSTTSGVNTNTTGNVSSTNGGTGGTATATLAVEIPPTITKSFAASSIAVGTGFNTTLTLTITNPTGNTVSLTGVAVSDTFPTGLQVASTPSATNSGCGSPTFSPGAGATTINFSNGTITANGTCTASVHVSATAVGTYTNTTGTVSSTNGGTGLTASATLSADAPPTITKAFGTSPILAGGTSTLTLTITNPSGNPVDLTGVAVSDTFPSGLTVASAPNATNSCGGTFTANANATSISLTGGTVPANSFCAVSASVTASTGNSYVNTTGTVSATNGGTGTTASATLVVNQAPAITSAASTTFLVNSAGSFTVTATGYPAPTFSETGSLPSGVTLSSAGLLSGTPTSAGTFPITITASNGIGSNATQNFVLTVVKSPQVQASGSNRATTGTTVTISNFTVPAGLPGDTYLIVGVSMHASGTPSVVSISWNGSTTNFALIAGITNSRRVEMWQLHNPTPATSSIIVTTTGSDNFVAGAVLVSGVMTGGPTSAFRVVSGSNRYITVSGTSSPAASGTFTTAAGDLVIDAICVQNDGAAGNSTDTAGTGQTKQWGLSNGTSGDVTGDGSTKPITSGTTTSTSWTLGTSGNWGLVAISIIPSPTSNQRKGQTIVAWDKPAERTLDVQSLTFPGASERRDVGGSWQESEVREPKVVARFEPRSR